MTDPGDFETKLNEFSLAMEKFKTQRIYIHSKIVVSVMIMALQAITLFNVFQTYKGTSAFLLFTAFVVAYLITDFVNGLVHMYMDNNVNYTSFVGPFVSSFHYHHSKPRYEKRHPLKVYFYESGTKFWLLGYLFILMIIQQMVSLHDCLNLGLVSLGILSSVAEVSHYWCHNATPKNKIIKRLQQYRILLSREHHAAHHHSDNMQYAFLNGVTDPLLNIISHYCYQGYKNHSDLHMAAYLKRMNSTTSTL